MNKVTFHRFIDSDFLQTKKLFKKTFNRNISKNYYKWRYFNNKKYNSFIAKIGNQIIGHIGFVEYRLNLRIKKTIKNIYSRHSSMVVKKYRRNNVYSSLLKWSIQRLKNNSGIIIWPNDINILTSTNLNLKYNFEYNLFIKNIYKKSNNEKKIKFKRLNQLILKKKLIQNNNINKNINFIEKDLNYFKWRYSTYDIKSYYCFEKTINKIINIFIIGTIKRDKKNFISILDYIGSNEYYYEILNELVTNLEFSQFSSKNYILQIWSNKKDTKKILYLNKNKFKFSKKTFNISLLNIDDQIKYNFNNLNFDMGDTDVFINLNKIN